MVERHGSDDKPKTDLDRFEAYAIERGHYTIPKYIGWFKSIEAARKELEIEMKLEKIK